MTGTVRQHSVVNLGIPPQEAIQIARRVLATEGYQSVAVGPTAATFVRDVRPAGITIAAYACAIPTLGLSLFALLIRSQDQCTVTGETSRRGTALSLSGVVTAGTLKDLESALRQRSEANGGPPVDDGSSPFPTPSGGAPAQRPVTPSTPARSVGPAGLRESAPRIGGLAARANARPGGPAPAGIPTGPDGFPEPAPLPTAPPRPPVRPDLSKPLLAPQPSNADLLKRPRVPPGFPENVASNELEMTVVRASPLAAEPTRRVQPPEPPPFPRWVVTLDDGRTIDVPDFALIGRDPEPGENDPEAGLVSLIDPEMSVSKTHAAFGVDDEGLWFLDRYSTNGTSMKAPGGERVGLEPGVATPVESGSDVWIGRRHLTVERSDDEGVSPYPPP